MKDLFYPTSIAVIGASSNPLKVGARIVENILRSQYKGDLYLVNRGGGMVHGHPVIQDVSSLPVGIDVAIIVIPGKDVEGVLEQLGQKSLKYAVIISAGFREAGKNGIEREIKLQTIGQRYGIRIIGPNCLGVVVNESHQLAYSGSFGLFVPTSGNISLISQSGALISSITDKASKIGFGFNKIVSIGNKADVDETDLVRFFADDAKTEVIALYLEGIKRPKEFIQTLQKVDKPVVILKGGRSVYAKKAISSHTGSIAGEDVVINTLLSEVRALRVYSLDEFFNSLYLLSTHRQVSRGNVGVITNAGGMGVLTADALSEKGMELADISSRAQEAMMQSLPPASSVKNPVDVLGDADELRYQVAIDALLKEKNITSILVILTPQVMTPVQKIAQIIVESQKKYQHKVVVPIFIGGDGVSEAVDIFKKAQMAYYSSPEDALQALHNLYIYTTKSKRAKIWDSPTAYIKKQSLERVSEHIARNKKTGNIALDFEAVTVVSEEFGIKMPKFEYVTSADEISSIAKSISYPLVMKVVESSLLHRSDAGGVLVGVTSKKEMKTFWEQHKQGQVIAQKMAEKGLEIFVGVKRDLQFGNVLTVGSGGIYAELLQDFAFCSVPTTKPYILQTLKKTKIYRMLTGARGKTYDLEFLIDQIYRISLFAHTFEEVQEIDVNPIIVYPKSGCVVDYKIILRT